MILRVVPRRRFKNQILCDLHFADVALMECSDFMQQLRSFKPQSLGCAVARRKSSTTLIFPLPPQACSGKYFCPNHSLLLSLFLPPSLSLSLSLSRLLISVTSKSRFSRKRALGVATLNPPTFTVHMYEKPQVVPPVLDYA